MQRERSTEGGQLKDIHEGAPHRSYQQRMEALKNANEIRSARAAAKRHVKQHKDPTLLVEQLAAPTQQFESMKVLDLLISLPKIGRVKANKVLRTTQTSPSKTLGGLSDRQRRELLALIARDVRVARFSRAQLAEAIC